MKRGCLSWLAGIALFWTAGVAAAKLLPLGDEPRDSAERLYHRNAVEMRHYLHSNPIAGLLSRLFVYRISVADLREVPNSCKDATTSDLPQMANVVGRVTDHGLFGLPLSVYEATCAGNAIGRGAPDYRPRPTSRPVRHGQAVELDDPSRQPPFPPPPGLSPPPAPSAR